MFTDNVDDARACAFRVVEIGETIAKARPEMQKRGRRFASDTVVTIGCAGDNTFEKPEHTAHSCDAIERGDKVHLGGARIREAHIDAASDQRSYQTFCAVHVCSRENVRHAA
jgi:hypothetical protein